MLEPEHVVTPALATLSTMPSIVPDDAGPTITSALSEFNKRVESLGGDVRRGAVVGVLEDDRLAVHAAGRVDLVDRHRDGHVQRVEDDGEVAGLTAASAPTVSVPSTLPRSAALAAVVLDAELALSSSSPPHAARAMASALTTATSVSH